MARRASPLAVVEASSASVDISDGLQNVSTFDDSEQLRGDEFQCTKCAQKCDSLETLEEHVAMIHLRWLRFKCSFCGVFTPTEEQMLRHLAQSHPIRPLEMTYLPDAHNAAALRQLIASSSSGNGQLRKIGKSAAVQTVGNVGFASESATIDALVLKSELVMESKLNLDSTFVQLQDVSDISDVSSTQIEDENPNLQNSSAAESGEKLNRSRSSTPVGNQNEQFPELNTEFEAISEETKTLPRDQTTGSDQHMDTEQQVQCQLCLEHIGSTQLQVHARSMHREACRRLFDCSHCRSCFPTVVDAQSHVASAHPRVNPSQIGFAEQPMSPRQALLSFKRCFPQTLPKRGRPPKRPESGAQNGAVAGGGKRKTPSQMKRCALCGRMTDCQLRHVRDHHLIEGVYQCGVCKKQFRRKHVLVMHLKQKHGDHGTTNVIDRSDDFQEAFDSWLSECFPGEYKA